MVAYSKSAVDKALEKEASELKQKVNSVYLPPDLQKKVLGMVDRLVRMARYGGYSTEYENLTRYVDWVASLPWQTRTVDRLELEKAKVILDKHHYGLGEIKERLFEYMAVLRLHRRRVDAISVSQESRETSGEIKLKSKNKMEVVSRAPILLFVGLVGTGKTTLAYAIADAMNRKFARIPFGGMGDAAQLRGQSRTFPDAEPGQIIKVLRRAASKNPVILLDEVDRVTEGARSDIMGVLIELLDPEQNSAFVDHYIDYPFDLSEVLFVATCNNTTNLSPAVLDRLEPIQMPSYTDEQKITIGKDYILPKAIAAAGFDKNALIIDEDVWPLMVRPLGFDAGIRTLERTIGGICRKVAKLVVEGKTKQCFVTKENIKNFLLD
jgi:ATP-dependent Lon protease